MADVSFNAGKLYMAQSAFVGKTVKLMLLTSAYTPNKDTHLTRADIEANEVSGTGYTAGGVTLTNQSITQDNTNDRAKVDYDDAVWTGATITARWAVLYVANGGASSADPVIEAYDFGADKTSTGGNFTVVFGANGVLYVGE